MGLISKSTEAVAVIFCDECSREVHLAEAEVLIVKRDEDLSSVDIYHKDCGHDEFPDELRKHYKRISFMQYLYNLLWHSGMVEQVLNVQNDTKLLISLPLGYNLSRYP